MPGEQNLRTPPPLPTPQLHPGSPNPRRSPLNSAEHELLRHPACVPSVADKPPSTCRWFYAQPRAAEPAPVVACSSESPLDSPAQTVYRKNLALVPADTC